MKNKKLLKLLAALTMSSAALVGCFAVGCKDKSKDNENPDEPPAHTTHSYTYTDNGDGTHNGTCSGCDVVITNEGHVDANNDNKCDLCPADLTPEVKHEHTIGDDNKCSECGAEFEDVTAAVDYTACIKQAGGEGSGHKPAADMTVGRFTFEAGVYFEASASGLTGGVVNNQQKKITFKLNGEGTSSSISFDLKGASGNGCVMSLYKVGEEGDEEVKTWDSVANSTSVTGLKQEGLEAGTYYLKSVGSGRLANITLTEKIEKSEAESITVSGAVSKFLIGEEFESTGLNVTLNYKNGRKDALTSGFTVDSDSYKKDVSGKYTITVKHTETEFTASYDVYVYAVESIAVSDHSLSASRVTLPVQKLFNKGGTFSSANLAVTATCSVEGVQEKEKFVLASDKVEVSSPDMATVGEKTITVTAYEKTTSYKINVLDLSGVSKTEASVAVNPTANVNVTGNVVTVNGINDALQVYKLIESADDTTKVINVDPGTYNEKVEVDMPNVQIIGTGSDATKAVIVYDAMNGVVDPSGTTSYSTDGSATISIRDKAKGFYAKNITFQNYWNTNALYNEAKKITTGTQAVACLVQADMVVFDNVRFSSYHDTLYDMTGRHVYNNCYIEGRTDYIFGYNSTAYFNECTISTIGAGVTEKNGGYIVATKGCSSGESDSVEYGYVFYKCTLTGDANVQDGSVSLARGWDNYMTLAFIECNISKAYSKEGYGNTKSQLNDRYTKMNADPKAELLFEYNNNGEGALTYEAGFSGLLKETVGEDGEYKICTILTAERAADFTNFEKIFGKKNGNLSYLLAWDGTPGAAITSKTLNFAELDTSIGNVTTGETPVELFGGDMTIKGGYRPNGNSAQFTIGTVIKMTKQGAVSISWYGGGYGSADNGKITYKDGYATIEIVEGTDANVYIKSIEIDYTNVPADTPEGGTSGEQTGAKAISTTVESFDVGDITAETNLDADGIIKIHGEIAKWSVDANNGNITDANGTAGKVTKRLKSNGANQKLSIDLSSFSGKVTIQAYIRSGSNSVLDRHIAIKDGDTTLLTSPDFASGNPMTTVELVVDCGKVYDIVTDAAVNFYALNIIPVTE